MSHGVPVALNIKPGDSRTVWVRESRAWPLSGLGSTSEIAEPTIR
jgi:hypothetical protein